MTSIKSDYIGLLHLISVPPPVEDQISRGAKRPIFPEEVLGTEILDGMNCHIYLSRRVARFFQWGLRRFLMRISKGGQSHFSTRAGGQGNFSSRVKDFKGFSCRGGNFFSNFQWESSNFSRGGLVIFPR